MRGICPGYFRKTRAEALVPRVRQTARGTFLWARGYWFGGLPCATDTCRMKCLGRKRNLLAGAFSFKERAGRLGSRVISGRDRQAMLGPLCRYAARPIAHPVAYSSNLGWVRILPVGHPSCARTLSLGRACPRRGSFLLGDRVMIGRLPPNARTSSVRGRAKRC